MVLSRRNKIFETTGTLFLENLVVTVLYLTDIGANFFALPVPFSTSCFSVLLPKCKNRHSDNRPPHVLQEVVINVRF